MIIAEQEKYIITGNYVPKAKSSLISMHQSSESDQFRALSTEFEILGRIA